MIVGLVLVGVVFREKKSKEGADVSLKVTPAQARASEPSANDHQTIGSSLKEEPWLPVVEVVNWREACNFPGCPWNFDGCESMEHVFERIWCNPIHQGLHDSSLVLMGKCKDVRVARCSYNVKTIDVQFLVVYVLKSGAELFAGAPRDFGVGVNLPDEDDESWVDIGSEGLRNRAGGPSPATRYAPKSPDLPLPCLAPFYRVHDGMGVLLNHQHIPVLMNSPYDSIKGSCFYVYPANAVKPFGRGNHLVKFARVDNKCIVCANMHDERSGVIYVDGNNALEPDEEDPLEFVADTVSNIAGHNALPAWASPYGMRH